MYGVGTVEAIEEHTVLDETACYYMLRLASSRMTAMVPVASAERVGLRPIIEHAECASVLSFLAEDPGEENENWNKRYRENHDKLRGGNIYDVADVLKCLHRRETAKGLSAGERKMLLTARQILFAELCEAGGAEIEETLVTMGF